MKRDNIHFSWNKALSYDKIWNFATTSREAGKSTATALMIFNAFIREGRPSVIVKRRIADMTATFIEDFAKTINEWIPEEKQIQLVYMKGDLKSGIIDVKMCSIDESPTYAQIKKMPVFIRVVALSSASGRVKSSILEKVKYMFFDEFICNITGNNEKYLKNEAFIFNEQYSTYNRHTTKYGLPPIKVLMAGNPYSFYNPYFEYYEVPTSKLKPGAFIVGPNYVVDCWQPCEELKEKILKANPNYQFSIYAEYAVAGNAIHDKNIRIQKFEPKGFKLKYVFKIGDKYISLHKGKADDYIWWCCQHDNTWINKMGKRKIVVFNFQDMVDGSSMLGGAERVELYPLKEAMRNRTITFNCIGAFYNLQEIYSAI